MLRFMRVLRMPEGDGAAGGGAPPPKEEPKKDQPKGDSPSDIAELKAQNASLLERLTKLEAAKLEPGGDDLAEKARKAREIENKNVNDTKALEAALSFNMNADKFLKENSALLPKEISDIFTQANKENYNSTLEKTAAIKAGVIQSFFAVQSNLDLLTPGLKSQLEEYLKLTNTGKQEKALQMYENIFEPAFAMLKSVRKAEALNRGHAFDTDDGYKTKLISLSRKHYLGEGS